MKDPQHGAAIPPQRYYAFGPYVLDSRRGLLWHQGALVPLTPKVFELLATLVSSAGELLGKDELIRRVWSGTVVEENNLARHISTIRKTLGERPGQREYIATVPGAGYRFVAEVAALDDLPPECRTTVPPKDGVGARADAPSPDDRIGVPTPAIPPHAVVIPRALWVSALAVLAVAAGGLASWIAAGGAEGWRSVPSVQRALSQLTYESGFQQDPAWSPDGRRLAYASDRLGHADIWIQATDESSPPLRLTTSPFNDWQPSWSPDGRQVVFRSERDGGGLSSSRPMAPESAGWPSSARIPSGRPPGAKSCSSPPIRRRPVRRGRSWPHRPGDRHASSVGPT
jgi:DNA-binding winged helix-turn-helix (wHTH) protein